MRVTKGGRAVVAATTIALAMAGCGGGGGSSNSKTVTVWTSVDQPVLDGLAKQLVPEAKKQGITLKITKVNNVNQLIMTKIQANDTPDIALIPQPGVVADIVKRGKAQPLDNVLDMTTLKSSMIPGTLDAGTVNGKLYGLLVSSSVKSLIFYPKKAWAKAGYTPPASIDELNALADKMRSDGNTPYCLGMGSDAATGWVATDWFEDLIMRYGGIQGYKDWVSHKTKFDSPVVRQAAAEFEKAAFTNGNVLGGRKAIASTAFAEAGNPMFTSPKPGCWMEKQGSFITTFFPKNIQKNLDAEVGVFGFPPATAGGDNPVLGAGDLATLLTTNTNAKKVMKLMARADSGKYAAATGSFLSPHKDFDSSQYPNAIMKSVADVAGKATAFLFDGSDAMPGAVGAGTFWKDMTSWISGQEDLNTALKNIDDSWPKS